VAFRESGHKYPHYEFLLIDCQTVNPLWMRISVVYFTLNVNRMDQMQPDLIAAESKIS